MSKTLQSGAFKRSLAAPMLFTVMEPALQEHLRKVSPVRIYDDGQIIQQRGDKAKGFWLIEEGTVRVGQFLPDGEFRAVALLGPGDSFGELALFARTSRIADAISREESQIRWITGELFLRVIEEYPVSMRAMLGTLSHQLQDVLSLLAGARRGNSAGRMAVLLMNMAGNTHTITVTQQELAELLGLTRATANAALHELEAAQMIKRGYASIQILAPDRLKSLALS